MADIALAVLNCILTLVTAYLGVHITMHPAETDRSKKAYKAAFCMCGLLICALSALQAHRNRQSSESLSGQVGRIESNTKNPPKVEVNVPPAQVIVEELSRGSKTDSVVSESYVQLRKIEVANDAFEIIPGKTVTFNVHLITSGGLVHHLRGLYSLRVGKIEDAKHIAEAFRRELQAKKALKTDGIDLEGEGYNPATTLPISDLEAKGLLNGTQFLYLQYWVDWRTISGNHGSIRQCIRQFSPLRIDLRGLNVDFATCEILK